MSQPTQHPAWCDPEQCSVDDEGNGSHASATITAGVTHRRPAPLSAYLHAFHGGQPGVIIHAETHIDDEGIVLPISIGESWHLSSLLGQLARMAETK